MPRIPKLSTLVLGLFVALAWSGHTSPRILSDGTWESPPARDGGRWFRVLHTNDLHGHVFPRKYAGENLPPRYLGRPVGGVFSVAAYLGALRRGRFLRDHDALRTYLQGKGDPFLYLDAGDWTGGALYDAETRGASTGRVLADPALDLDATVVGNHAWDYYREGLEGFLDELEGRIPVLGANLLEHGRPPGFVRPGIVKVVDGVRLGILGVLTEHAMRSALPAKTKGFSTSKILAALKENISSLADRADVVILLGHVGLEREEGLSADLATWLEGPGRGKVHLIVDGHSHRDREALLGGIPVVQADHFGTKLGEVLLELDRGGRPTGAFHTRRVVMDSASWPPPAAMVGRFQQELSARRTLEAEVVAPTKEGLIVPALPRSDARLVSPIGDLISQAFLYTVQGQPAGEGVTIAVMNQGGVRMGLYADGAAITRARLHGVLPFANVLAVMDVTGTALRRLVTKGIQTRTRLSFAGLGVGVRDGAKGGARDLVDLAAQDPQGVWLPVHEAGRYRLVTNEYLADQGFEPGEVLARRDLKLTDYQAVALALKSWADLDGRLDRGILQRRIPATIHGAD